MAEAPVVTPRWSLEEDESAPKPAPKIPRAAFIGGLSALAFTTGITIAMIPALKRNRQRSLDSAKQATQFVSNRTLGARPAALPARPMGSTLPTTLSGINPVHDSPAINSEPPPSLPPPTLLSQIRPPPSAPTTPNPSVTRYTGHESILYPPEDESSSSSAHGDNEDGVPHDHDPQAAISPLFALKAFGIATAVVAGTAVVGAWAIGRSMGVADMDEFTQSLRRIMNTSLPTLTSNIYRSPPITTPAQIAEQEAFEAVPGRKSEDDDVVGEWGRWIAGEVEGERLRLVEARRQGRWSA